MTWISSFLLLLHTKSSTFVPNCPWLATLLSVFLSFSLSLFSLSSSPPFLISQLLLRMFPRLPLSKDLFLSSDNINSAEMQVLKRYISITSFLKKHMEATKVSFAFFYRPADDALNALQHLHSQPSPTVTSNVPARVQDTLPRWSNVRHHTQHGIMHFHPECQHVNFLSIHSNFQHHLK